MRGFVAPTDHDWFTFLRAIEPPVDEVNFWRPGSESKSFRALRAGEPFFFKLKQPFNAIGGFGYFAHFSYLPLSVIWQIYGTRNGVGSFAEMRERLMRFRSRPGRLWTGCVLLNEPVLFSDDEWVRIPDDWAETVGQGKVYSLSSGEGARIWMECQARAAERRSSALQIADGGYGEPLLVRPRLGPRSFQIAILDSYGRRCAVTSERTLPALEAAHIRDFAEAPEHSINNGILFRADLHKLFDAGYVTVTPDYHFEVSRRIKEEFENGKDYYRLHGSSIRLPEDPAHLPLVEALWWHCEERFLG